MAFTLKHQKDLEAEIHEQLYSNIFILTLSYPTTKEFDKNFKSDMFIKNNKTAFQHIMHFLLNILDPTLFKQKTIVWPILEVKMEAQFRNEIMKYLNEVNLTNKDTGIPLIMTSHLISPGGYKFAEFMFRLSQFVLSEHIKQNAEAKSLVMFPPNANNDYNISCEQVHNMNKIVDDQYTMLVAKQAEFHLKLECAKNRSKHIVEQKKIYNQSSENMETKINEFLKLSENDISDLYNKNIEEREKLIEQKFKKLDEYKLYYKKCSDLIDVLNDGKNIVKLETDVDNETTIIENHKQTNSKDLIEYFEALVTTLRNNKYLLKIRKDSNYSDYVQVTSDILNELDEYCEKYEELISEFQMFKSELEDCSTEIYKNNGLSQKVHEIFSIVTPINIYTQN